MSPVKAAPWEGEQGCGTKSAHYRTLTSLMYHLLCSRQSHAASVTAGLYLGVETPATAVGSCRCTQL